MLRMLWLKSIYHESASCSCPVSPISSESLCEIEEERAGMRASLSAAAKLSVAVIVQSYRPKHYVWRAHEGRLFRAGGQEWVCGCLVTLGSDEAGFLSIVGGERRTCPHWWLGNAAPRLTALSERSEVCWWKSFRGFMHVLLSAFNMSYKEFGDVRLCFLKTVSFDLWLLISKEKPSIHLTFTFGDELLEHSALLIVSLNLYENFSGAS